MVNYIRRLFTRSLDLSLVNDLQSFGIDQEPFRHAREQQRRHIRILLGSYFPVACVIVVLFGFVLPQPAPNLPMGTRFADAAIFPVGIFAILLPYACFIVLSDNMARSRAYASVAGNASIVAIVAARIHETAPTGRELRANLKHIRRLEGSALTACILLSADLAQLSGARRTEKYEKPHRLVPALMLDAARAPYDEAKRRYMLMKVGELIGALRSGAFPLPTVTVHADLGLPAGRLERARTYLMPFVLTFVFSLIVALISRLLTPTH